MIVPCSYVCYFVLGITVNCPVKHILDLHLCLNQKYVVVFFFYFWYKLLTFQDISVVDVQCSGGAQMANICKNLTAMAQFHV